MSKAHRISRRAVAPIVGLADAAVAQLHTKVMRERVDVARNALSAFAEADMNDDNAAYGDARQTFLDARLA